MDSKWLSTRRRAFRGLAHRGFGTAFVAALFVTTLAGPVGLPQAAAESEVPEWQRVLGTPTISTGSAPNEPAGIERTRVTPEALPERLWELRSSLTLEGLNGTTSTVRLPVPPGGRPQRITGSITLPRGVASGTIKLVVRSGETDLASKRIKLDEATGLAANDRVQPFAINIPAAATLRTVEALTLSATASVVATDSSLNSSASSASSVGTGTCGTIPFSAINLSTQMKGEPLPISRVDDLFAAPRSAWPSTTSLDVIVPKSPSASETNAVLQTAAALGDSLRDAARGARVRVLNELPAPVPNLAPATARAMPIVLVDEDAPRGVHFSKSSDGRPTAVFGGTAKELSDATRLLWRPEHRSENDSSIAATSKSFTFDELGVGTVGAESVEDMKFSFEITQSMFGSPVESASFDLKLRHRALFASENAIATVALGSAISRSVRLRGDGQSVRIDLPKNAMPRDLNATVTVIQQHTTACADRKPLRVEIVGSSTVVATPGQGLPVRFERFPQVLLPTFGVEVAKTDSASLTNAALLLTELGRVSDRPLRPLLWQVGKVWSGSMRAAGLGTVEQSVQPSAAADGDMSIVRVGDPVRQLDLGELAATAGSVVTAERPGAQLLTRVEGRRNILTLEWTNASEASTLVGRIAEEDGGLLALTGNTALLRSRGFDDFALSAVQQRPRIAGKSYGIFGKVLGAIAFILLFAAFVRFLLVTRPRKLALYQPVASAPIDILGIDDDMIRNDDAWGDITPSVADIGSAVGGDNIGIALPQSSAVVATTHVSHAIEPSASANASTSTVAVTPITPVTAVTPITPVTDQELELMVGLAPIDSDAEVSAATSKPQQRPAKRKPTHKKRR